MNFRHGYGLIKDSRGRRTNHLFNQINTTAFLMDSLRDKVGNVMINTVSLRFGFCFTPIQHGKWDRAFALSGDPNVGFDFQNSPFGRDRFDAFVGNPSDELNYADVFTGFIFYKPLEQHIEKTGFPYISDNFEDSILRRAKCVSLSYAEGCKNEIENYKANGMSTETTRYAFLYNLIVHIGFSILIFLASIITLIFYWAKGKLTNRQ